MPKYDKYWRDATAVAVTITEDDILVVTVFTKTGQMPGFVLEANGDELRVIQEYDK